MQEIAVLPHGRTFTEAQEVRMGPIIPSMGHQLGRGDGSHLAKIPSSAEGRFKDGETVAPTQNPAGLKAYCGTQVILGFFRESWAL